MRNCRLKRRSGRILNQLGYFPKKVAKSQPKKKIPETDAIFDQMKQVNEAADADAKTLRSLDRCQSNHQDWSLFSVLVRVECKSRLCDHDFSESKSPTSHAGRAFSCLTSDELFLYGVTSKVTSDCLVDRLVQWWETVKDRFSHIKTLVINLDNGEDKSQSAHENLMQRLMGFVRAVSHHGPFG